MRNLVAVPLLVVLTLLGGPAVAAEVEPLPTGTDVDYQLGGAIDAPAHVGIVVRDREEPPQEGRYNVCYVNGFQTQPQEKRFWRKRPQLLLHDRTGDLVVDEAWGEWLLDLRTAEKRKRISRIVGRWTAGCAEDGFDAVEYDNLDSFTRSDGLLRRGHALRYARLLTKRAHREGLSVGQKNLAGFDGHRVGYDFAVSEECGRYDECGAYVADYGDQVLMVEYRTRDFRRTCEQHGATHAVVLRDRDLSPKGVHSWC
ncbi:endo alpha-1,4 polygalactosaminidase [Nocardioides sp.]|uniref:endo alpha-1,4 polygalactosaminidase n=1 Tax=Nocardioides sp. TaxID=35761 RepID=UPI001A2F1E83|nr:endo alpha-1,4 polygalactosaminidase [Nocardioides sp.]MBJ7359292.1 endo alpha-1,4 polygalactosaminidase [Nocardioides sp.]